MRTLANLLKALQSVDLKTSATDAMADTAPQYVALQKDQLINGITSKTTGIGKYRSNKYADMKFQISSLAGHGNVDLKLTGAFYNSIRADIDNEGLVVSASDEKAPMLEKKYGNDIYTLGGKRKQSYIELVRPIFINNIAESLKQ